MNKMSKQVIGVGLGIVIFIGFAMWGYPNYRVWQRELSGQAALAEAEWTRKIVIEEANAQKEAAKALAEAEVERAKGVAQANEIIGKSLENNESYLRYLWIQGLQDGSSEIIYIPTEANMPILEASRHLDSKSPPPPKVSK
ncbi:MAG: membrane protease subunit [Candidatus Thorarchaeota archaeon]